MESSEPLTHETMQAPDLVEVVRRPGPFLSLYLNTEGDIENAARRSATRWRVVRSDIEARGVPDPVLDEIGRLVPHAHLEGRCLAVIADAEGVLHTEHGPAVSSADEALWEPVPHVLPIVRWRQSEPPYVVALTDRTGADLYGFRRGAPELHGEVEGEHDVIRKVQAGGWSQRRYQQRAEDSWAGNAEQVAERVTELVDRIEAKLLVVAGDVRAVQLLQGSLPGRVQALVHVVHGERPREAPGDAIPDEVSDLVATYVRRGADEILARFEEERGQRDKAVEGFEATARALTRAQAAVLLTPAGRGDRSLWFGPELTTLALTDRELKELGVDSPQQGEAHDVLVGATLGTGARLRVLEDLEAGRGPREGVGALLRWTTG
jgi:hypothetical protein